MPTHMEKAASKTMGAFKGAKGAITGLSGVFETLMKEHGEVSALLLRAKASDDPATRARLWTTIRKELLAHEKGEMAAVYPVYEEYSETRELALHHNAEAKDLAALITRIDGIPTADEAWGPTFDELVELVKHHVKEEESSLFPAGQKTFGERTDAMQRQYLQKKEQLLLQV